MKSLAAFDRMSGTGLPPIIRLSATGDAGFRVRNDTSAPSIGKTLPSRFIVPVPAGGVPRTDVGTDRPASPEPADQRGLTAP